MEGKKRMKGKIQGKKLGYVCQENGREGEHERGGEERWINKS